VSGNRFAGKHNRKNLDQILWEEAKDTANTEIKATMRRIQDAVLADIAAGAMPVDEYNRPQFQLADARYLVTKQMLAQLLFSDQKMVADAAQDAVASAGPKGRKILESRAGLVKALTAADDTPALEA